MTTEFASTLVKPGTIVTQTFDVEQTRPFFEAQLLDSMSHLLPSQEQLKETYLSRDKYCNEQYEDYEIQDQWSGWKKGVMLGYELWGKGGGRQWE